MRVPSSGSGQLDELALLIGERLRPEGLLVGVGVDGLAQELDGDAALPPTQAHAAQGHLREVAQVLPQPLLGPHGGGSEALLVHPADELALLLGHDALVLVALLEAPVQHAHLVVDGRQAQRVAHVAQQGLGLVALVLVGDDRQAALVLAAAVQRHASTVEESALARRSPSSLLPAPAGLLLLASPSRRRGGAGGGGDGVPSSLFRGAALLL